MKKVKQFHQNFESHEKILARSMSVCLLSNTHHLIVQEFDEKPSKLINNVMQVRLKPFLLYSITVVNCIIVLWKNLPNQ